MGWGGVGANVEQKQNRPDDSQQNWEVKRIDGKGAKRRHVEETSSTLFWYIKDRNKIPCTGKGSRILRE